MCLINVKILTATLNKNDKYILIEAVYFLCFIVYIVQEYKDTPSTDS